jgi:ABC-type branched-subunit amino acid transport system ATPase component
VALLSVKNLNVQFGGIKAVKDVSFDINQGEILGLIGPNGAGKTTLINTICRYNAPVSGSITFQGLDLLKKKTHELAKLGIGRSFQDLVASPAMTIRDCLLAGQHSSFTSNLFRESFRLPSELKEETVRKLSSRKVMKFLRSSREASEPPSDQAGFPQLEGRGGYPDLIDMEEYPVGMLPYAVKKRVDLARALVGQPSLLLLDEPAAGLREKDLQEIAVVIRKIRDEMGITILLIEHHMSLVMALCNRIVVIDQGAKISEGTPQEVKQDPAVVKAYLGDPDNVSALKGRKRTVVEAKALLKVQSIDVEYGPHRALDSVSIEVRKGQIVSVLGANGAGKSTLLKAISNVEKIKSGAIFYNEKQIIFPLLTPDPSKTVSSGIFHVPEGRQLFSELSVRQNILLGGVRRQWRNEKSLEKVFHYFPKLKGKLDMQAGSLSGGEQQMVAIAQGIMAEPELLLLDEPSLGLAPNLVNEIFEIIVNINSNEGCTILLVEQNASMALNVSDYAYILDTGKLVSQGESEKILQDKQIFQAYLS